MTSGIKPWRAGGETVAPIVQRLGALVRAQLPPMSAIDSQAWEYGNWNAHAAEAPPADALILDQLAWHFVEGSICEQREVGHWRFTGLAFVAQRRVDFSGTSIRDLCTGAFLDFHLDTVGL